MEKSTAHIMKVHVLYILRSTKTGQTLYKREGIITVDKSFEKDSKNPAGIPFSPILPAVFFCKARKVATG